MKKTFFSLVVTLFCAGMTYASITAAEVQAVSLPQPSSILICAAGIAFFCLTLKRAK